MRLRGVLDDWDRRIDDRTEPRNIDHVSKHVHGHDGPRASSEHGRDLVEIHEESIPAHVDKYGLRTSVDDGRDGRDCGERSRDDLVTGFDSEGPEGESQPVGSVADAYYVLHTEIAREILLEARELFGHEITPGGEHFCDRSVDFFLVGQVLRDQIAAPDHPSASAK